VMTLKFMQCWSARRTKVDRRGADNCQPAEETNPSA